MMPDAATALYFTTSRGAWDASQCLQPTVDGSCSTFSSDQTGLRRPLPVQWFSVPHLFHVSQPSHPRGNTTNGRRHFPLNRYEHGFTVHKWVKNQCISSIKVDLIKHGLAETLMDQPSIKLKFDILKGWCD